ncbi:hypothetical protein ABIA30_003858 [Mycobacterium sp. MAA66]
MIRHMHSQPPTVPPIETATEPIHSTADLHQRWRALMGRLGFGERLLWVGFVGPDRRMLKILVDLPRPPRPDRELADGLMDELAAVLDDEMDPGTTVALLLTGPGSGPVSELSRQWAAALAASAAEYAVPIEPIFGANDHELIEVAPPLRQAG